MGLTPHQQPETWTTTLLRGPQTKGHEDLVGEQHPPGILEGFLGWRHHAGH